MCHWGAPCGGWSRSTPWRFGRERRMRRPDDRSRLLLTAYASSRRPSAAIASPTLEGSSALKWMPSKLLEAITPRVEERAVVPARVLPAVAGNSCDLASAPSNIWWYFGEPCHDRRCHQQDAGCTTIESFLDHSVLVSQRLCQHLRPPGLRPEPPFVAGSKPPGVRVPWHRIVFMPARAGSWSGNAAT